MNSSNEQNPDSGAQPAKLPEQPVSSSAPSTIPQPPEPVSAPSAPPGPTGAGGGGGPGGLGTSESSPSSGSTSRSWDVACHLSGFLVYLTGFGHLLGPLIIWLLKRQESPSVDAHGKEALNFQISFTLYSIGLLLGGLLIGFLTCGIGLYVAGVLAILLTIAHLVLMIVAAIQASEGRLYRYPCTLRFIH